MANRYEKAAKQIDWSSEYDHAPPTFGIAGPLIGALTQLRDPDLGPRYHWETDETRWSHGLFCALHLDFNLRRDWKRRDRVPVVPGYERFERGVSDWRTALPFAEGELVRLVAMHGALWEDMGKTSEFYLPVLRLRPDFSFMDRGQRQTASGPELANRWGEWLEQRGPYEGQGSLMAARAGLIAMASVVPLSDFHRDGLYRLRAEPGYAID